MKRRMSSWIGNDSDLLFQIGQAHQIRSDNIGDSWKGRRFKSKIACEITFYRICRNEFGLARSVDDGHDDGNGNLNLK